MDLAAIFTSWIVLKKPDLSMALNGMLAGLVGITAGAGAITPWGAVLVGASPACWWSFSVLFFDKIRIDDPVGAISVHGVCGIWGTLAVGIFGKEESGEIVHDPVDRHAYRAFAFIVSFVLFIILKVIWVCGLTPKRSTKVWTSPSTARRPTTIVGRKKFKPTNQGRAGNGPPFLSIFLA